MGRKLQFLSLSRIPEAISYLERSIARDEAEVFQVKPEKRKEALASIKIKLPRTSEDERPRAFHEWCVRTLSPKGRTRMMNALRRIKADANPAKKKRGTINVPSTTLRLIQEFAEKLGMPVPLLLECMTEVIRSDPSTKDKVIRLAVAINMK